MHIEQINEPVEVLVAFRTDRAEPLMFRWGKKKYRVTKINLVHTLNDGRERIHYYSVTGEGAVYRLAYRPLLFSWILEEICLE